MSPGHTAICRMKLLSIPSKKLGALALVALALLMVGGWSRAEPSAADKAAEKAARRTQLQLQNLQNQLQEAQAAKSKLEADKATADQQLGEQTKELDTLKATLTKTQARLGASEKARAESTATVASLEKQMAEQKREHEQVLAKKASELAAYTKLRDEQQAQLQRKHDDQVALVAECSAKNEKLLKLNTELLDRYRNKSVTDIIKQREPFIGTGEVEVFNQVQDYRDKADAERFKAPTAPAVNR